jgi:hypothetical protein
MTDTPYNDLTPDIILIRLFELSEIKDALLKEYHGNTCEDDLIRIDNEVDRLNDIRSVYFKRLRELFLT